MSITLNKVSGTPTSVLYRNPSNLSQALSVTAQIAPVKRDKSQYNHIKKSVRISDIVKVPNLCGSASCLTSPVVLEVRYSAPEGVDPAVYNGIMTAALANLGGVGGVFIPQSESITTG